VSLALRQWMARAGAKAPVRGGEQTGLA